jgi:hypothetical protein
VPYTAWEQRPPDKQPDEHRHLMVVAREIWMIEVCIVALSTALERSNGKADRPEEQGVRNKPTSTGLRRWCLRTWHCVFSWIVNSRAFI